MALFAFIKIALVVSVLYLLFKYLTRKTLPPGVRRLPGPKGGIAHSLSEFPFADEDPQGYHLSAVSTMYPLQPHG